MKTPYYTEYKLEKRWNYNLAEYEWVLYGLRKYMVMSYDSQEDRDRNGNVWSEIAYGDIAWAERTAKKFNIWVSE